MTGAPVATDGRVPGRRGRATRQRLLEATADSLAATSWRSVTVTDIARRAGTSPATFYQYFGNVEQAISVLAEDLVEDGVGLAELVGGEWSPAASWATSQALCRGFLDYWEANRSLFYVLDLAADLDTPLAGVRVRALRALTMALAAAVASHGSAAADNPVAVAVSLVAMLASVARRRAALSALGVPANDLFDSEARLVHFAVTGRPGPAAGG